MNQDWSWRHSALQYVRVYERALAKRRAAAAAPAISFAGSGHLTPYGNGPGHATSHRAFFWHQHQPYYPDDVSGETLMPWVRLHATKDYYGMALHLKEVPEFRCTINLVPSLLMQLQAYTEGRSDRHLDVSRLADGRHERGRRLLSARTISSWPTSTA